MPFPDDGGLVPGFLKQFRESLLPAVEHGTVVREPVRMAVLAGQHAGPAGAADGVGHETVCEPRAFPGYAVYVGRLDEPVVVGAYRLIRVIVRHDVDDIHRLLLRIFTGCRLFPITRGGRHRNGRQGKQ